MDMEHVPFRSQYITDTHSTSVGFKFLGNSNGNANAIICTAFNAYDPRVILHELIL